MKTMDQDISVSIIIPVYNVENYLKACLQSVQKQAIEKIEIICVEDCSTDGSLAVLETCAEEDGRIVILKNEKNEGLSYSRNRGMLAASGKYLMFVDSDDLLAENALIELCDYMSKHEADAILFNMTVILEGEAAREKYENISDKSGRDIEPGIYGRGELLNAFSKICDWKVEAWRYFWKREKLLQMGIQFYPGLIYEDNLFSFYAWMKADRIVYLKRAYYIYRKRDGSIMYSHSYRQAESLFLIFDEILHYWKEQRFSEETDDAIRTYLDSIYRSFLQKKVYAPKYEKLSFGSPADVYLYEKMWSQGRPVFTYAFLSKEKIQRLKEAPKVVVYGAGNVGGEAIQLLEQEGIRISAVAVTNLENNSTTINGYDIKDICSLESWNKIAVVLLAAVERHHASMLRILKEHGFENVMMFDARDK